MEPLEQVTGRLRLLLAQIAHQRGQLEGLRRQFQRQLERVVGYGVYGEIDLGQVLSLMADLEAKQADLGKTLERLERLEKGARGELESLELTRAVEQAKAEMSSLEGQVSLDREQQARLEDLRRFVSEASEEAARRIVGEGKPWGSSAAR